MADHGCLMTDPMMRAVLSGDKTVTRRIGNAWARARVGDRLWFREVWKPDESPDGQAGYLYRCDGAFNLTNGRYGSYAEWKRLRDGKNDRSWQSSMIMPRSVCRATGIITSIGQVPLQDIDEADALREGMETVKYSDILALRGKAPINELRDIADLWRPLDPVERFMVIFDILNPGQWQLNPLVWRVEWERE